MVFTATNKPHPAYRATTLGSATLSFTGAGEASLYLAPLEHRPAARVELRLLGALGEASPAAQAPSNTRIHVLTGLDSGAETAPVEGYHELRYGEVYPGISLTYSGDGRRLESTFEILPGADPSPLAWSLSPLAAMTVGSGPGEITLDVIAGDRGEGTARRQLIQRRPRAWQDGAAGPEEVAVRYLIRNGEMGSSITLAFGAYDESRPLRVSSRLYYSPYFDDHETQRGHDGNLYLVGSTYATHPEEAPLGSRDAFVASLDASGKWIRFQTFLGEVASDDLGLGLDVASAAGLYLTGEIDARETGDRDAFVARLPHDGSRILATRRLGSHGPDAGHDLIVDHDGTVLLVGSGQGPEGQVDRGTSFGTILPRDGAARRYFTARLAPDLEAVLSHSTFEGSALGSRLRAWKSCDGGAVNVGLKVQSVLETAEKAACLPFRQDATEKAKAPPPSCPATDTYQMTQLGGPYNDSYVQACWGGFALRWKELRHGSTYHPQNVPLFPCASVSFGDEMTLNDLEANTSVFPTNPPWGWAIADSFSGEELAVCAALFMDRHGTPVFSNLELGSFGTTTSVAIKKVVFTVTSPFGDRVKDLCDWLGWSDLDTPIDNVDSSCAGSYGTDFVLSSVQGADWADGLYNETVTYSPSNWLANYSFGSPCIGDPPDGEEHLAAAYSELARRLRKQVYIELDKNTVEHKQYRDGQVSLTASPTTSKVRVRSSDLARDLLIKLSETP